MNGSRHSFYGTQVVATTSKQDPAKKTVVLTKTTSGKQQGNSIPRAIAPSSGKLQGKIKLNKKVEDEEGTSHYGQYVKSNFQAKANGKMQTQSRHNASENDHLKT